jgi:hypothetical protein
MRSLVTEIILGLAIIWNAANAQVSANKLVERRLGTEVLFHHNSQGSMSGDEEEHRQNACSCNVAANASVRIHEDFFNRHRICQQ